jgi:site-specific DNA-methyltransferase (adenine-specific)
MIELNKIHHGDCMTIMKDLPDKSIDMILCDLPYGTTQNKWDSIIPLFELWEEYERITKDDSPIVLTSAQPFTAKLVLSNVDLFKYEWIWQKTDSTNYLNAKHQPLRIHESILVFYKKAKYNPQGLRPFEKLIKDGKKRTTENYGETKGDQYKQEFTNYPESVLIFESANNTIHPTQKPVDLFRYLIRTYSDRGGVVLDNCIGSGTTALACLQEDRNYIGIEKNKEYYDNAVKRIEQYRSQLNLF